MTREDIINEIKRCEEAIKRSNSIKLKGQYTKHINRLKKQLRREDGITYQQ